nr:hypothetical protein [Tanacetum cinerariifolium]GFA13054.1 hypothetical protein [Tanacetum cinerariifolium]
MDLKPLPIQPCSGMRYIAIGLWLYVCWSNYRFTLVKLVVGSPSIEHHLMDKISQDEVRMSYHLHNRDLVLNMVHHSDFYNLFFANNFYRYTFSCYIGDIVSQLRDHYADASILVFNFREGDATSQLASALSNYDMTIVEYPRHYEGCPLLSMEMIHHFLRSCESWLSLGMQNVLLMHCERGGWPVLAFMLAALLIYRKYYSGESKTLDMVYKQAPSELLHLFSSVNPLPSQLSDYLLQAECELVIIDVDCHIQGDIVLECINLHDDWEHENIIFRAMFNTSFIRSNILILNRDEIDILWDAKDQFPKDFKAEFLFSEMDAAASITPVDSYFFEDEEELPIEAFATVQEMFSSVDWLIPENDVAFDMLRDIATADYDHIPTPTSIT